MRVMSSYRWKTADIILMLLHGAGHSERMTVSPCHLSSFPYLVFKFVPRIVSNFSTLAEALVTRSVARQHGGTFTQSG